MKRLMILCLVLVLGASLPTTAFALGLDDQGNPNDPAVNERANACYEGGTMAERCFTELDWIAGWYLIRFEYGIFSRSDVPEWVAWILPPEPEWVPNTNGGSGGGEPGPGPTEEPTAEPTEEPTTEPTVEPTAEPTEEPTAAPTEEPTEEPTAEPTEEPTPTPPAEPGTNCQTITDDLSRSYDVDFAGGYYLPSGSSQYQAGSSCGLDNGRGIPNSLVYAINGASAANDICVYYGFSSASLFASAPFYTCNS